MLGKYRFNARHANLFKCIFEEFLIFYVFATRLVWNVVEDFSFFIRLVEVSVCLYSITQIFSHVYPSILYYIIFFKNRIWFINIYV